MAGDERPWEAPDADEGRLATDHAPLDLRGLALLGAVLLVNLVFMIVAQGYFSAITMTTIAQALSYTTVAALALYLIILLGHIDLSIGSVMALTAAVCCTLIQAGWPAPAAMGVALVVNVVLYAGMGFLVAWQGVPAFIVTLGGLLAFRGLADMIIGNRFVAAKVGGSDNALSVLGTWRLPLWLTIALLVALAAGLLAAVALQRRARRRHELPLRPWWQDLIMPTIAVVLATLGVVVLEHDLGVPLYLPLLALIGVVVWFVAMRTRFGRWCFAVGGNSEAARLSGIPVRLVTLGVFMIAGVLATIAGFFITAAAGSVTPSTGNLMELDAIAACVIGGVSLMGGRGNVSRVFLGALLIVCLVTGMGSLNLEPYHKGIVRGLVLVLAVWLDMHVQRRPRVG